MDMGKIEPVSADPAVTRMGTEPGPAGAPPVQTGSSGAGPESAAATTVLADEVNIHPLDVAGALQILIAEVRAALTVPGDLPGTAAVGEDNAPPPTNPASLISGDAVRAELALLEVAVRSDYLMLAGTSMQATAATAPLLMVEMLLKRLSEDETQEPAAWLAAATRAELALRSGMDQAVDAVIAWRNVPARVVDVAKDTRAVVSAAVDDDPPSALWLRPEWLGLAPRMQRFWRRRRYARRNLRDPDLETPVAERYDPPGERES